MIQYSDVSLEVLRILVFTKTVYAEDVIIYPKVDTSAEYLYLDRVIHGRDIEENGIRVTNLKDNSAKTVILTKK